MKLKSLYSFLLATALVACNEDFNEGIAGIQTADPESPAAAVTFSATAASATTIDLGALAEGATTVKVCSFTATPSTETTTVTHVLDLRDVDNNSYKVDLTENGEAAVDELQTVIETVFNKRPIERSFDAYVYEYQNTDGQALIGKSEKITIIITPKAPVIEEEYYFIGTTNNWTAGDATLKFSHSGNDVYEDPIFTITVEAPYSSEGVRIDNWFKIAPKSAYAEGANFWDLLLGSDEKDGDERKEAGLQLGGGSFVQKATDEAKFYTITLNMLEYTMTVEPLRFEEFIYAPGDPKWNPAEAPALRSPNYDGVYEGYAYLTTNGFKFVGTRDGWEPQWNYTSFITYSEGITGSDNICPPANAFYQIKADIPKNNLTLTETSWSIIGSATGDSSWGTDLDMTYVEEDESWTYTGALVAGEFKFRANKGWDISFGGASFDDLTSDNGANLQITEDGNYEVKFFLTRSKSNKIYTTITKQ